MHKESGSGASESLRSNNYLYDRLSYSGNSERIQGFNRIAKAIGEIANIKTVEPIILSDKLYYEYAANGLSSRIVKNCATEIWSKLWGEKYPLIVRRLFPDQDGKTKTGLRSGNVQSVDDLINEIGKSYDFFTKKYKTSEVSPEIMVHQVVDVGNPPLQESPFLPYPGGDVTPIGNRTYQVRATFGADESVQGFPCDMWIVKYNPDGSVMISSPTRALKTRSKIPAAGDYMRIRIPKDAQTMLPLNHRQVISLTDVAKNLESQYGGHRLEFDGTIVNGQKALIIIEASPFKKYNNSYENLKPFGDNIVRPLNLIASINDAEDLQSSGDLVIAHLAPRMFQRNDLRIALIDLALTAKAKRIPLAVLVAGDIATQHAVRDIVDCGHAVWFTGNEQFKSGEKIRLFKTLDGGYDWERENPIVEQRQIQGRNIEKIGGKAWGLQQLEAHGFQTSPYFTIETSLFRRIIDDLGLSKTFSELDSLSSTDRYEYINNLTKDIARQIINYTGSKIPDLENALVKIGGQRFSVRSSATLEDGRMSFAGIFKTELNVKAGGLRKAILKVMASAVDPLAIKEALGIGIRPSEISMAVIVQRMIDAQAAGTIFTKEHLTKDESILEIEATRGFGDQIVDGTAENTQQIRIVKKTGEIKSNDFSLGLGPILNINQIKRLMILGKDVEKAFKGPQDIEWAIEQEGDIFLLQTRPL